MNALRRRRDLLIAIAGGLVFALSSPPTDIYPAVIVGLTLLALSLADGPSFWRAFGRGAAWGTAAGLLGLRFVPSVILRFTPLGSAPSYLALVLLAAAQSLVWAIGAGVAALLYRRARAPFEISFAAGVFVAVSLPTIFAWTPAGLVTPWPAFVQLGDLIGERGVSALFAIGAALFARAILALLGRAPNRAAIPTPALPPRLSSAAAPAIAGVALFTALPIYGALRMRAVEQSSRDLPTLRVGLVDHTIGPHERWDAKNHTAILQKLRELTRALEAQGAELTIWPEAAYPYPLAHDVRMTPRGSRAIVGNGVRGPVLAGLITRDKPTRLDSGQLEINSFNSATLVLPDGSMLPPYDKLQLLWFGEMVPGGAQLPWLRRMFQKSGGLIPGSEPRALELERPGSPQVRMAVLNCYEDTLASVGRRVTSALLPNLLVNVTNDAWFFNTAEPELHARLAVMRAIELRLDLVRAVNMGISSWVDASGTKRADHAGSSPATLLVTPAIRAATLTPYARFGDTPLQILFALLCAAFAWRARTRETESAPDAAAALTSSATGQESVSATQSHDK